MPSGSPPTQTPAEPRMPRAYSQTPRDTRPGNPMAWEVATVAARPPISPPMIPNGPWCPPRLSRPAPRRCPVPSRPRRSAPIATIVRLCADGARGKEAAMRADEQLAAHARELIDGNRYMTLGTADADGNPWVTPVFYATADYASFYWVSRTAAVHSRTLARRPPLSIVIFDSTVPAETGRAVYMPPTARELAGRDLDLAVQIYPGPAARGGSAWSPDEVRPPEPHRPSRRAAPSFSALGPTQPPP